MSDIPPVVYGSDEPAGAPVDSFDALGSEYDKLLETPDEMISVPRSQMQRYANEHKSYRQKYGAYKQVFDGAPDEDVRAIGQFYGALRSGNPENIKAAAEWINGVITTLTPAEQAAVKAEVKEIAAETGQTQAEVKAQLTEADIQRIAEERAMKLYDERDRKRQEEAKVSTIVSNMQSRGRQLAEEHGVPAWSDPNHRLYGMLVQATSQVLAQKGGDPVEAMNEAALLLMEDFQGVNTALLSKKKATAGAGAKPSPKVGTEPVGQGKPDSMAEASRRGLARLMADIPGK